MGWWQDNNCYYTYDTSDLEEVLSFSNSDERPQLVVRVFERLTLKGSKSANCGNPPRSYRARATYWFALEEGVWKIEEYVVD